MNDKIKAIEHKFLKFQRISDDEITTLIEEYRLLEGRLDNEIDFQRDVLMKKLEDAEYRCTTQFKAKCDWIDRAVKAELKLSGKTAELEAMSQTSDIFDKQVCAWHDRAITAEQIIHEMEYDNG